MTVEQVYQYCPTRNQKDYICKKLYVERPSNRNFIIAMCLCLLLQHLAYLLGKEPTNLRAIDLSYDPHY